MAHFPYRSVCSFRDILLDHGVRDAFPHLDILQAEQISRIVLRTRVWCLQSQYLYMSGQAEDKHVIIRLRNFSVISNAYGTRAS